MLPRTVFLGYIFFADSMGLPSKFNHCDV